VFGPLWPAYRDKLLNPPPDEMPLPAMKSADSERVDLDTSAAQVLSAPALPAMPLVVLTKTESFAGLKSVPGAAGRRRQPPLRTRPRGGGRAGAGDATDSRHG